jgi:hypothetical protein
MQTEQAKTLPRQVILKKQSPEPSDQQTRTDSARSVFIFNTPSDQQNIQNARKFKAQFGMRKARFNLPVNPQTFSFLYLLTEAMPANFSHPRVYNYSEVPNESAKPASPTPAVKPSRPNRISGPTASSAAAVKSNKPD